MVGLYEDPFAYDGSDFNAFLGHDQFATASSPEDFHVSSATEPSFPPAVHSLKGPPAHHPHHQPFLSPTDPLGPSFDDALRAHAHLPRSVPAGFQPGSNPRSLTLDTMGLAWNTTAGGTNTITSTSAVANVTAAAAAAAAAATTTTTTTTTSTSSNPTAQALHAAFPPNLPDSADDMRTLVATLQAELRQAAQERDEARLQLSEARAELYAARQTERRLRVERDEARSHADFLGAERAKMKQTEARLRRERNEARMAVLSGVGGGAGGAGGLKGGRAAGSGKRGGPAAVAATSAAAAAAAGQIGMAAGLVGVESQGEESGESPPMGMDQS